MGEREGGFDYWEVVWSIRGGERNVRPGGGGGGLVRRMGEMRDGEIREWGREMALPWGRGERGNFSGRRGEWGKVRPQSGGVQMTGEEEGKLSGKKSERGVCGWSA